MSLLNLKPAASGMSHHSFDVSSIQSLDFGDLLPTRVIETVKRDHFTKVSAQGILRLAPQVFPTFGKCFIKSAAFFVPEYQLFEASDAFHSNMNTWKGKPVVLPHFSSTFMNTLFDSVDYSTVVRTVSDPTDSSLIGLDDYDFVHVNTSSSEASYVFCRLNAYGRRYYKILKSLGYDFTSYDYSSGITGSQAVDSGRFDVNALPFLAYIKVYCDFFLNPQHYNNSPLVALLNSIQFGNDYVSGGTTWYTASTGVISNTCIIQLLKGVLLPHQSSRYLDAWNSPISPNGDSVFSSLSNVPRADGLISPYVPSINSSANDLLSLSNSGVYYANSSTPNGSVTNMRYLTSFGLKILEGFDKFVKRRGLAGNKAVERIYAAFGVKSDFFSGHYCHKIFDSASRIDFNPVLSNSDTENSSSDYPGMSLGSYAGFASSGLNYSFEHKCDSFGYIICLSWIQIVPMLMRGFHPSVLRTSCLDFYTPEYDGATVRAIPQAELSVCKSCVSNSTDANGQKNVYGYMNLYDDYRFQRDMIAGDFIISKNARSFLFGRDLGYWRDLMSTPKPQNNLVHYYTTSIYADSPSADMTDPFQYGPSLGDRFYLQLDFDIQVDRPIKSDSESVDLNGEGDLLFSMNGNSLS